MHCLVDPLEKQRLHAATIFCCRFSFWKSLSPTPKPGQCPNSFIVNLQTNGLLQRSFSSGRSSPDEAQAATNPSLQPFIKKNKNKKITLKSQKASSIYRGLTQRQCLCLFHLLRPVLEIRTTRLNSRDFEVVFFFLKIFFKWGKYTEHL